MEISSVNIKINATRKEIEKYIGQLSSGEKEYKFDTHEGFTFLKGNIGKVGSLFYTKEKFFGMYVKLFFEITEFSKNKIAFKLIKPFGSFNVHGFFSIKGNKLTLKIFSKGNSKFKEFLIKLVLPMYKPAVKKQITKEVQFIKKEIEK